MGPVQRGAHRKTHGGGSNQERKGKKNRWGVFQGETVPKKKRCAEAVSESPVRAASSPKRARPAVVPDETSEVKPER